MPRQDHVSTPKNIWSHVFSPNPLTNAAEQTIPIPPTSNPSAASTLPLWSRKLALQSEELRALIQQSVTQLKTQQDELRGLLQSSAEEVKHIKKDLETVVERRDEEFDTKLTAIRRLTQTTTDMLHSTSAKLSKLDLLSALEQRLQAHESLLQDIVQDQAEQKSALEEVLKLLRKVDEGMSLNSQERELHVGKVRSVKSDSIPRSTTVVGSAGRAQTKRMRRLMSDEELAAATREGLDEGLVLTRVVKRKLLSTQDEEMFSLEL
ncbi:hypothetical protein RUND412_007637 [Rhizina undulata]